MLQPPSPSLQPSPLASPLSRPSTPPNTSPPASSAPNSPSKEDAPDSSSVLVQKKPYVHSALSTLLLDDSPLKAVRQPYNHVCIPEYDAKKRASDLAALMRSKMKTELEESKSSATQSDSLMAVPEDSGAADSAAANEVQDSTHDSPSDTVDEETQKKRKRLDKKEKRRAERLAKAAELIAAEGNDAEEEEGFDPTLLAVIGVLDEVKLQKNVASWIRVGGLWGSAERFRLASAASEDTEGDSDQSSVDASQRPVHTDATTDAEVASGAAVDTDEDGRDATKRKRARHHEGSDTNNVPQETFDNRLESTENAHVGIGQTSVDPKSVAIAQDESSKPMWFEDPDTLRYWVQRGKRALEHLGLPIDHGIER